MVQLFDLVRPGDLITADFMHRVLNELNSLESRVSLLEAGLPPSDAVAITALIPDGPLRIGQELQVVGQNFGFLTGANRVTIDSVPINAFKLGTTDQRLIFDIPTVPNIPASGRLVILFVTNQRTSAQRSLLLLPVSQVLQGGVDVTWTDIQPATPTPGNSVTFRYHLRSRTNAAATFTITPVISGVANSPDWQSQLAVLDSFQNPISSHAITLDAGQEKDFFIRLNTVPPNTTGGTTFNLTVTVTADSVTGFDGPRPFTVGQASQPDDPSITAAAPTAEAVSGGASLDTSTIPFTIRSPVNGLIRVSIIFSLHVAGTYNVSTRVAQGTNWSSMIHAQTTPTSFQVTADDLANPASETSRNLRFIISATAGASPTGLVEFLVQRVGTPTGRTVRLQLALA